MQGRARPALYQFLKNQKRVEPYLEQAVSTRENDRGHLLHVGKKYVHQLPITSLLVEAAYANSKFYIFHKIYGHGWTG